MLKSMTLRSTLAAVACAISFSAHAMADSPMKVEIPAGDLRPALLQLSRSFGVELFYQPSQLDHFHTAGVKGSYTPEAAVRILLKGTPLELRTDPSGAMMVIDPKAPRAAAVNALTEQASPPPDGGTQAPPTGDSLRLAQGNPAAAANERNDETSEQKRETLQEVIVTAQKREERLQDVPVPVTVVSAGALIESNQPRLQDFFFTVPGLNMSPPAGGSNEQNIAIRGITSGAGASPTVAIAIDDVPFGTSSGFVGDIIPDIDPADLARIEVLRGPQGTLYGASGLGGLIKYVTVDPSTDSVSGGVQAGTSSVYNGAELGYNVRGSVNVPLNDAIAIRASGFTREEPGYIDNPILNINGINEERVSGGRLSGLWRYSDTLSLKLSAMFQYDKGDGAGEVNLPVAGYPQTFGLGDLQQNYIRGLGGYFKKIQAYSAILKYQIGDIELTSLTGYDVTHTHSSLDYSFAIGGFFGVPGAAFIDDNELRTFSEELRASIHMGPKYDWLVGAFFTHQGATNDGEIPAIDPATGAFVGNILSTWTPRGNEGSKYQDSAVFTDLTVHVTDKFNVQIGGRESRLLQTSDPTYSSGVLNGNQTTLSPRGEPNTANAFTYLLTPQFKISPDLMAYVRLASGYRPGGGTNKPAPTDSCVTFHFPCQYAPDKTYNYEIGVKGDVLDHRLSFDSSLYYIDWKDMQIQAILPATGFGYLSNGGGAKSEGVEMSMEARPLSGLTVSIWGVYGDAVLSQDFPPGNYYGVTGNRLPFSAHFSGNLSANQDFAITATASAFAGFTMIYQGNSIGNFGPTADRQRYSPYARTDVRAGVKYGHSWKVNLFVNNITDKRAFIGGGGEYNFPPFGYVVTQPRTVGLILERSF
jgi:iron complex outermembrane receptor protein